MDEQTDVQRMAKVLIDAEPVKVETSAYNAFVLCGLLQLAMRSPVLPPGTPNYEIATTMIEDLAQALAGIDPYLKDLIQKSSNPDNDVPIFKQGETRTIGEFFQSES